ncbi:MAG TPA: potassium transporter KefB [Methanosarcinaceae archaeon]|nr:potassium transporter KefB [Methanosarcinaceae archaeon]
METTLLNDIIIIFGMAIAILFVSHRFRVPSIVGLLLTGMIAGPYGLAVLGSVAEIEVLAEIGIVLLLFTIGMELSLKDMWQIKKAVFLGGSVQVLVTLLAAALIANYLGRSPGESIFIGFLLALSSTAIVLKLLQERAEIDSPHGRITLAILIFQDVIIVPMILVTPLLGGASGNGGESPLVLLAMGILLIFVVIAGARWIVPQLLYQIVKTRNSELFLLSIIVICFSVALFTYSTGLSLALGAFLAGLIISESEYGHQAIGNILPFRDVFMSFFFISIGMLLDINFLFQQPLLIVLIALGVILLKAIIAGLATVVLGYPLRTTIMVSLALVQVGEFSFILSKFGIEYGLLTWDTYQLFLSVSVATMAATPFIIHASPHIADSVMRLPLPKRIKSGLYHVKMEEQTDKIQLKDHLIVVGFGINGRNVARVARVAGIPYIIIETNPDTVLIEKSKDELICYGDATQEAVLKHVNIKDARVMVVGISDPLATRRIISTARRLSPKLHMITRTRYLQEMGPLYDLGADEVVPQEFETSVEIFVRVLKKYLIPKDIIETFMAEVRADGYEMFRNLSRESSDFCDLKLNLSDLDVSTIRVEKGSQVSGKTLAQVELRKKYGVTMIASCRDGESSSNPDANIRLCPGDMLVLLGTPEKIAEVTGLFVAPETFNENENSQ